MTYIEHIPNGQLSNYIDKFWYCQANNLTNSTLTVPLLHHELVINFSGNYYLSYDATFSNVIKKPMSWISGIQTKPCFTRNEGKHEMLGVLFKPNGLNAFIKYNSSEFKNAFFDATNVFDHSFSYLIEQLQNIEIPKRKIFILKNYLIKKLKPNNFPQYLKSSLDLLRFQNDERVFVKEICNQLLISNKSLIQSYKKYIGITPVKYLQLQQINKALFYLSTEPKQSYTSLAYKLNFYDQSHFIKLFKSVTSLTPSQYSKYILENDAFSNSTNYILIEG